MKCYSQIAGKKYWKISLVVKVITCENIGFITRGLRPLMITLTTNTFCQLYGNLSLICWDIKIGSEYFFLKVFWNRNKQFRKSKLRHPQKTVINGSFVGEMRILLWDEGEKWDKIYDDFFGSVMVIVVWLLAMNFSNGQKHTYCISIINGLFSFLGVLAQSCHKYLGGAWSHPKWLLLHLWYISKGAKLASAMALVDFLPRP